MKTTCDNDDDVHISSRQNAYIPNGFRKVHEKKSPKNHNRKSIYATDGWQKIGERRIENQWIYLVYDWTVQYNNRRQNVQRQLSIFIDHL